jgi:hypothetical protein
VLDYGDWPKHRIHIYLKVAEFRRDASTEYEIIIHEKLSKHLL